MNRCSIYWRFYSFLSCTYHFLHFDTLLYEYTLLAQYQRTHECGVHMLAILTFYGGRLGYQKACDIFSYYQQCEHRYDDVVHYLSSSFRLYAYRPRQSLVVATPHACAKKNSEAL
jgi:hypothetical protein